MRIVTGRRLRGPNQYLSRPVYVAEVRLDDLTERESTDVPGFTDRLLAVLPGLAEHHCAAGQPGGFVARLREGTYFGHVAEHVAIELSGLIGRGGNFGRTTYAGEPGWYRIVLECPLDEPEDDPVARSLLALAIEVIRQCLARRQPDYTGRLATVRSAYESARPGPSTAAIARAARDRDIPVERVGALSLLRLGQGRHRRLVWAAMTDQTSAVGVDIASDKQLTRQLLDEAGIPVPPGGVAGGAHGAEQAVALFERLAGPVVIKPRRGRQGSHVYLELDTPEAVLAAYRSATSDGGEAVVERQLGGRDYRVLMIGERLAAAAERVAAQVVGDGRTPVVELVARANADPRRGDGHGRELTRLTLDEVAGTVLRHQGMTVDSVPAAGQPVRLRDNANLSTGGTSRDVTDLVHPDVAELCRRVVALVGLDIAGIDLRLPDIAAPLPATAVGSCPAGGVIEVNASPGLRMHLTPATGASRDAAAAIVDALYPAGVPARIPTVAVTGTNGKTTVARLTGHLLTGAGLRVGLTTTDGVYVGGRLIQRADATGPRSAQLVLGDPTVDAAVLETARGGLLRHGLGYDWSDVGVLTNVAADHLGQDGVHTIAELVELKALVAERVREGGTVVLNADDPHCRDIPARLGQHRQFVWFSVDPANALIRRHWHDGGRAYLLADGWLVELAERKWLPLLPAAEVAGSFDGAARYALGNAMAAAAAARAMGVPARVVADRLRSFRTWDGNPGRGMLLRLGDVHVLVDYAHNPAAIAAIGDLASRVWGPGRTVAAVTLPGDRRDDLLVAAGRAVAERFGRVVLYEDQDRRGRAPGEVPALVRDAIADSRSRCTCSVVQTVDQAVPAALALAGPGDVVVVLYEQIEPVLALLDTLGAEPVPAAAAPAEPAVFAGIS